VDAFGDTQLVVQQVRGESQCLDGILNLYCEQCLDIIKMLDTFNINRIPREENREANLLAQQVSGYMVTRGVFLVKERPTSLDLPVCNDESICKEGGALVTSGSEGHRS
jgi:hypothetical protein